LYKVLSQATIVFIYFGRTKPRYSMFSTVQVPGTKETKGSNQNGRMMYSEDMSHGPEVEGVTIINPFR
jgi:predicted nucleic acid-binding protein